MFCKFVQHLSKANQQVYFLSSRIVRASATCYAAGHKKHARNNKHRSPAAHVGFSIPLTGGVTRKAARPHLWYELTDFCCWKASKGHQKFWSHAVGLLFESGCAREMAVSHFEHRVVSLLGTEPPEPPGLEAFRGPEPLDGKDAWAISESPKEANTEERDFSQAAWNFGFRTNRTQERRKPFANVSDLATKRGEGAALTCPFNTAPCWRLRLLPSCADRRGRLLRRRRQRRQRVPRDRRGLPRWGPGEG